MPSSVKDKPIFFAVFFAMTKVNINNIIPRSVNVNSTIAYVNTTFRRGGGSEETKT
ncbi:hypothetical protein RhiirA4_395668 [Rhizophagus irregularis]|uniref:Uncharacterized protein n=1 Tax=Rhizophagus irregularis TaxID=588596 RepID=A0A2I1G3M6_9GLOM|nr:hypothetical protein RhiirA4_395668 [Rhizophagus irregularis]